MHNQILRRKSLFLILITGLISLTTIAQQTQTKITDYVLFGGRELDKRAGVTTPGAPGFGVQIGASGNIVSGKVGSYTLVTTTGSANFGGNIHSGGTVNLGSSNTVNGSITGGNVPPVSPSTALTVSVGTSAKITGNIDANGNVKVSGGTISGNVTHPSGTTYTGVSIGARNITGTPNLPLLPALPAIKSFSSGSQDVTAAQVLYPGYYGNMALSGNMKVTLSGPGVFFFKAIKNTGINTIEFNFQGAPGNFLLLVEGDVNLGNGVTTLINLPASTTALQAASRIFTEVHGTGSTCADKFSAFTATSGTAKACTWVGTVWAPYGSINFNNSACSGSSSITGALYSGSQVKLAGKITLTFAPFANDDFTPSNNPTSDIIPAYDPPIGGKSNDLIGPELTTLCHNFGNGAIPSSDIYKIVGNYVYIEVLTKIGQTAAAKALLISAYGMTDFTDNGFDSLKLTGKIPISSLCPMNSDLALKALVTSFSPLFPAIKSSGAVYTKGDSAQRSDAVRQSFSLLGSGIKVGVLSDSYDKVGVGQAQDNVNSKDLPGSGNADYPNPVQVLKEYPQDASDEGRAMLQIIHDVAPAADLAFRTGFISEGDFAKGIIELQEAGCKVITDDITYINAPFFKDGVAAKAVDSVKKKGVSYITAAGNFASNAYEGVFTPAAPPPALSGGQAHNFADPGGTKIYQSDSLIFEPGNSYVIVLQWEDSIYSLQQGGALNDLDIYLANDDGTVLFGMNRFNAGNDPVEVLGFSVKKTTKTNIVITRASGTGNVRFKYVVFKGNIKFNEFNTGNSTIIGHANAQGAMTIGAARYTRTPAFGQTPPLLESFSSVGKTPVYGVRRNKPDFVGPDGGNTTVFLSPVNAINDLEADGIPNFFGTSAAAPHVAGVAALILEGKKVFYNKDLEPDSVRLILANSALDMADPGFDSSTGAGFIQADAALQSFASPRPQLDSLIFDSVTYKPGQTPFPLKIKGKYLKPTTTVYIRNTAIPTAFVNSTELNADVPTFPPGNPPVYLNTPAISETQKDGGNSDTLYFFSHKINIIVTADNKSKKYGDTIPTFTSTITADGQPFESSGYSLSDVKLDTIIYKTPATDTTNAGFAIIEPGFKTLSAADSTVFEAFNYTFVTGTLSINKLPLVITPKDTAVDYGDKIGGFAFNYAYDSSAFVQRDWFRNKLINVYYQSLDTTIVGLIPETDSYGNVLTSVQLQNLATMASAFSIKNAKSIKNGFSIKNGINASDTTKLVDLALQSLVQYQSNPSDTSELFTTDSGSVRGLFNAKSIKNGVSIKNGASIKNGMSIKNGASIKNSFSDTSNSNVAVIIDSADYNADQISDLRSVNTITGLKNGDHWIVPGGLVSENFLINYGIGKLTIRPVKLQVTADDKSITQGNALPTYTSQITGLKYKDVVTSGPSYALSPAYSGKSGTYSIIPSNVQLTCTTCYVVSYTPGTLFVDPSGCKGNVKPSLICVDTLIGDPDGFKYVANFGWTNPNSTSIYVPTGINNYITALGKYKGTLPTTFAPLSTGQFQVKFDGKKMTWTLKSSKKYQNTAVASDAICTANRCKKTGVILSSTSISSVQIQGTTDKTGITPNPTTGKFIVSTEKGFMSDRDVFMSDVTGKKITPNRINRMAPNSLQIEMPNSAINGVYFLKVKVDDNYKIFRVVKL